ncbi:MAG: glycosyltransferase family 4 protein [Patescibacteria group bacterium]
MNGKPKICSVVSDLGIGGTARQLVTMDKYLNKDFFEHFVVSIGSADNTRVKDLDLKKVFFVKNAKEAAEIIRNNQFDAVYFQRHGRNEIAHDILVSEIPKNILVVEMNTFSAYDSGPFGKRCDIHVFVSSVNILKYLKQNNLSFNFDSQKVVYGLVDTANFKKNIPTQFEIDQFKNKYGLKGHFIIGRLARPVLGKWDDRTIIFWRRISRLNTNIKFLIYGVPEEKKEKLIEAGNSANLIILEPTSSDKELALFYTSINTLVHLSPIGECNCGAIAEAMMFGKAIVVTSTPFPRRTLGRVHTRDNGQIEQIKNGENGFVVNNALTMAEAVDYLSCNPEVVKKMGYANKIEVENKYNATIGIKTLEKIFLDGVERKGKELTPEVKQYSNGLKYYPDQKLITYWFAEYYKRLNDVFGKGRFSLVDCFSSFYFILSRKFNTLLRIILQKV